MAVYQIGDGNTNSDGIMLGVSSAYYVGLWGKTPITQPSGASQASVPSAAISTASITSGSGVYGFTSLATASTLILQVNSLTVLANAIQTALVNSGIMKGS